MASNTTTHTSSYTTISFYRYVVIEDPQAFRLRFCDLCEKYECRGRVYVAREGVNAQMAVPTAWFTSFAEAIGRMPELRDVDIKEAVRERAQPSFRKLQVKVRAKIVADGLDDASVPLTKRGAYLSPEEMNEYVQDPNALVIDVRNNYESAIGHFRGALTPDADTFREELAMLPRLLARKQVAKDTPIALYCTGGIRCEKASAWLSHQGYRNVRHLRGGIIRYAHEVRRRGLPNLFRGSNFVFDGRLVERVGEQPITFCQRCGHTRTDQYSHCAFSVCHTLFLSCEECLSTHGVYCSRRCRFFGRMPRRWQRRYARLYNKYFKAPTYRKPRLRS